MKSVKYKNRTTLEDMARAVSQFSVMLVHILITFVICLVQLISAHRVHYDGYKVYRIFTPTAKKRAFIFNNLLPQTKYADEWQTVEHFTDVMLPPGGQNFFQNTLHNANITYDVIVDDVEQIVAEEENRNSIVKRSILNWGELSYDSYHRFDTITSYLNHLSIFHPSVVSLITIGRSFEGRDLIAVRISSLPRRNRPAVLIDAGMHAREWIGPATALHVLDRLVGRRNPRDRRLAEELDWYILPVVNPDGYEYTHVKDRFWRKTRSRRFNIFDCIGVDGNRNFDYHWNTINNGGDDPCDAEYAGPRPFSESEIRALARFARLLATRRRLKLYLTLHSAAQAILYPWGHTLNRTNDANKLHFLGEQVNKALGNKYRVGSCSSRMRGPMGGTSIDWIKARAGVELAYALELPRGGRNRFDMPAEMILQTVSEVWKGIAVFAEHVIAKYGDG